MPGIDPALAAQRRQAMARNYMVLAGTYFQAHRYRDFARCAARSGRSGPPPRDYLARYPSGRAPDVPSERPVVTEVPPSRPIHVLYVVYWGRSSPSAAPWSCRP